MKRGQSLIEYAIVLMAAGIAFLSIGAYFKVRVEGKWRDNTHEFGDLLFEPNATAETISTTVGAVSTQTSLPVLSEDSGQ